MAMTRLHKVIRRRVDTENGPLTVLMRPGRNGRPAVIEVRVRKGRKPLASLVVRDPRAALEQLPLELNP